MSGATFDTISRRVRINDAVTIGARSVHLQDAQMEIGLGIDAGTGSSVHSYMTCAKARQLAAALIEVANQYEAVRQEIAA